MGEFERQLAEGYTAKLNRQALLDANDLYRVGTASVVGTTVPFTDIDTRRAEVRMDPWLTISRVRNGWVLTTDDGHDLFQDDDIISDAENHVILLSEIAGILGMTGTRYDAQRISISLRPGDKHHDLHPKPCRDCACRCDPDRSDASVAENRTDVYGSTEWTAPATTTNEATR